MINNIVFDFGGVLMDWDPRYLYRDYFETKEEMEWFLSTICTGEWNSRQDAGRSLEEGTLRLLEWYDSVRPIFNPELEKKKDYTDLIKLYYDRWEVMLHSDIPETVALIHRLKEKGYSIYGLTNWSAETIQVAYSRYTFFREFDGIVVSGEEHTAKPNLRIYSTLIERYRLVPEETVFIDDHRSNLTPAEALGIHTFLFDSSNPARSCRELELRYLNPSF